jgi:hypothetical protein
VGAVKAGGARRSEPLTPPTGSDNRVLLNAGMVRHSAMEARARRCRTNCLKPPSVLPEWRTSLTVDAELGRASLCRALLLRDPEMVYIWPETSHC